LTYSEHLNVALNSSALLMLTLDLAVGKRATLDDLLGVTVGELDGRAVRVHEGSQLFIRWRMRRRQTHLMMDLPNQVETTLPSAVMVKTTLKVSLSWPGVRLQSVSLRTCGSIGTARWTR